VTDATVDTAPAPDALARVLAEAPFVRLVATDDGDALAAAGVLARALRTCSVPFHLRIAADPRPEPTDDDRAVVIGADRGPHAVAGTRVPASVTAFAVARTLGADPDPVTALAGVVAAGSTPGGDGSDAVLTAAESAGLAAQRPGVAVPTAAVVDDLAASTLLRTPYSGDSDATHAAVESLELPVELGTDAHRRLASLVAVDVTTAADASTQSATAVERALGPYAIVADDIPFETVGGYADVLEVLAREAPGTGVALALSAAPDDDIVAAALDAWRTHGTTAHAALDAASVGRYDGCAVFRVDTTQSVLPTVARLARDFSSPEPVTIAVNEAAGRVAVSATEPCAIGDACRAAARETDETGWGTPARGGMDVAGDPTDALAALREVL
jgi:hypothetical protein